MIAFKVPYPSGTADYPMGQVMFAGVDATIVSDTGDEHDPRPCDWCGAALVCDCHERITCERSGAPGHYACGWCKEHNGPRFVCLFVHSVPR